MKNSPLALAITGVIVAIPVYFDAAFVILVTIAKQLSKKTGIPLARFVTALANLIAKLPILNQFNKVGGIVYGAIRGILVIYVVLLIVSFVGQINPQNKLHTEIQKSFIAKEMYSKNIVELLVK